MGGLRIAGLLRHPGTNLAQTRQGHPLFAAPLRCSSPSGPCLVVADGGPIKSLGVQRIKLQFSNTIFSPPEFKYSAFDRELLAVYSAIKHFRFLLEGIKIMNFSDHKPLPTALHSTFPPLSAQVQRQLAFIAEYTADLRYLPRMSNVVADALSRPLSPPGVVAALDRSNDVSLAAFGPVSSLPRINFVEMACLQRVCQEVAALHGSSSTVIANVPAGFMRLFGDASTGFFHPFVPVSMRCAVFYALHSVGHPGMQATHHAPHFVALRLVRPGCAGQSVGT